MSIKITEPRKPPSLAPRTRKLFAEAEAAGFVHLGWLTVTMLMSLPIAGFANKDGSVALTFIGSAGSGPFEPRAIDMVSHLDGPRKLTSTTLDFVFAQSERGIFKYSHSEASIKELLRHHQKHMRDLKAEPVLFVKTLSDLETSIREYLAFEHCAK